ncbi:MAG: alpha/beta hydrolase [Saprospiraceae bacterium]
MKKSLFLIVIILMMSWPIQELKAQITHKDLLFATVEDRPLYLDLFLPSNEPNPFLIVWVHGGAWHAGSRANPPTALLAKGYAIASVDYRLSVEARFPAQIHDIKAAIRFLRGNAKKYGYRSDQIVVWGASAGGHLAALVGTTNGHPELEGSLGEYLDQSADVQAVVDFYGPTNFLTILNQSTPHGISVRAPALALLLGRPVEQVPDLAKLASPVFQVDAADPPLFIAHGDQDNQVPINQSLELQGAYEALGLKVQMEVVHGAGHGSRDYYDPAFQDTLAAFLAAVLKQ